MKGFRKPWAPLAARAADRGVRIAFENCDMGGRWESARFNVAHAPTAWEMMFNEVPSDNLGLEWEPCHARILGQSAPDMPAPLTGAQRKGVP